MNTLYACVGLPRSGKSTWSRRQGVPIVNPDSIRLAIHGQAFYGPAEDMVWTIAKLMVRSLFLAGHTQVILDATNITQGRRERFKSKEWSNVYVLCATPPLECIQRADGNKELIDAITRMAGEWDAPIVRKGCSLRLQPDGERWEDGETFNITE